MSNKLFFGIAIGLFLVGLVTHLMFVNTAAWDWDEPVYTNISQNAEMLGYPAFITNSGGKPEFYAYNPPFHFKLLSWWYGATGSNSVEEGRVLSSIMAAIAVLAAIWTTMVVTNGNKVSALIVGSLLCIDGWYSYTSLLVKLDTTSTVIGTMGIGLFVLCLRNQRWSTAVLAGFLIGFASVYKHVGAIVFLALMIHWVITGRKLTRTHIIVGLSAIAVILAYIVGMALLVKDPFINANLVQIRRTLGLQEARGLTYGLPEIIKALVQTYWAYGGTIIAIGCTCVVALRRVFQHFKLQETALAPLTAWIIAACMVLGAIKLRNPSYLVYLIVPSSIYIGIHISIWMQHERERVRTLATALFVVILLFNVGSIVLRLTDLSGVNALEAIKEKVSELPPDTVIFSEEPVCAMVKQTCYNFGLFESPKKLATIESSIEYIIVYTSITQSPPSTPEIMKMIAESEEVYTVQGWKEKISILRRPSLK